MCEIFLWIDKKWGVLWRIFLPRDVRKRLEGRFLGGWGEGKFGIFLGLGAILGIVDVFASCAFLCR